MVRICFLEANVQFVSHWGVGGFSVIHFMQIVKRNEIITLFHPKYPFHGYTVVNLDQREDDLYTICWPNYFLVFALHFPSKVSDMNTLVDSL